MIQSSPAAAGKITANNRINRAHPIAAPGGFFLI